MVKNLAGSGTLPPHLSSSVQPPELPGHSQLLQPGLLLYHYILGGGTVVQPPLPSQPQQLPISFVPTPLVPKASVSLPSAPFPPSSSSSLPSQARLMHDSPMAARTSSPVREAATQTAGNEKETEEVIKPVLPRPTSLEIKVCFSLYTNVFSNSCYLCILCRCILPMSRCVFVYVLHSVLLTMCMCVLYDTLSSMCVCCY